MNEQFSLLKDQILKRIENFDKKRISYRRGTARTYFSTAILAALSTVLLGMHIDGWAEPVRVIVLIITAFLSILNSYNAFYNYKELWVANNDALNKLYALGFSMDFAAKGKNPLSDQDIQAFKDQYQSILNELNQVWYKSRKDNHASKNI